MPIDPTYVTPDRILSTTWDMLFFATVIVGLIFITIRFGRWIAETVLLLRSVALGGRR